MNVGEMGAASDEEKVIDLSVCRVVAGNSVSHEGLDRGRLERESRSPEANSVS